MSGDMFLKLDGIDGGSVDDTHKKEIDVLSWSWDMVQSGTTHMGEGGGSGKVSVGDISFSKYVDEATNKLIQFCCSGKHVDEGVLVVRKAGDTPLEYLKITMKKILITSYNTGGDKDSSDRVMENISLNFAEVKVEYVPQNPDGSGGGAMMAGWHIAENKKV